MSLNDSIFTWLSSGFQLSGGRPSTTSVSDGMELALVLQQIDSNHFNEAWKAKLKSDIPAENKRLKSNNVKKVLNGILEYYSDVLAISLGEFPLPDCNKVAEGNDKEVGRLLQLVLGCAVNCENKGLYIESIMKLEESVQQVIMTAIQELMNLQASHVDASMPGMTQSDLRKLMDDLAEANREKDDLKQKCHEMENQINMLKDEKINISSEYEQLQAQVAGTVGSKKDLEPGAPHQEWKKQVEGLNESLFKVESQRDEFGVKVELLEKQLEESQTKEAELQKLADQALKLKDELDILRETADKVAKYEATIDSYKKKLEDLGDLKRQVKILEEKNTDYLQKNMELEEDVKKTGNWKPQIDAYKKQIAELHAKLDSETKKSDRLEFETKKMIEKVEALSVERDRLQAEREDLKTKNDDLQDEIKFGQATRDGGAKIDGEPDSGTLEMIPSSVKERLLRLQHENKKLKSALNSANGDGSGGSGSNAELLQTMIEDLKERETALQTSNRKANQKIMELESKLEEGVANVAAPPRVPGSREELELKLAEANKKINNLQDTVQKKDLEMSGMEERYKKYIEKAKSVIKTLDPKQGSGPGGPEVTVLRTQINEKDKLIETLEHETEKARAVREMEERLISSAFYNLSMQMHRNAVESRLGHVNASGAPGHGTGGGPGQAHHGSAQTGQSFLARQRQVQQQASAGKGKGGYHGNNDFLDY